MKNNPSFPPSSFEKVFDVFNPFLHIDQYKNSYYLILFAALNGNRDAFVARSIKAEAYNFLDFDKAPQTPFYPSQSLDHYEAQVNGMGWNLQQNERYYQLFLDLHSSPQRREQAILNFDRARKGLRGVKIR